MKYMGGKFRLRKEILPIILNNKTKDQWYVEPFSGGMNVIEHVEGKRIANDIHPYLIDLFKSVVNYGWNMPKHISEEEYVNIRNEKDKFPTPLVGFVGFGSFGGKWFGGYPRNKRNTDYWGEHYRSINRQINRLKGTNFENKDYKELYIPYKSIIYSDPPYKGKTKYKDSIDSDEFWEWNRIKKSQGHQVFISEYEAPEDFTCVWEKEVKVTVGQSNLKKSSEKLFTLK